MEAQNLVKKAIIKRLKGLFQRQGLLTEDQKKKSVFKNFK